MLETVRPMAAIHRIRNQLRVHQFARRGRGQVHHAHYLGRKKADTVTLTSTWHMAQKHEYADSGYTWETFSMRIRAHSTPATPAARIGEGHQAVLKIDGDRKRRAWTR